MFRIILLFFTVIPFSVSHYSSTQGHSEPGDYDDTLEKKKNIPVEPPESSILHFRENYDGGHPIIREFVSDRPKYLRKKNLVSIREESDENNISKRFDLYPKWYSQRIPTMFGKRFSKTYFNPFSRKQMSSRDHIARHRSFGRPIHNGLHELPMSWLEPHHKQTIQMARRRQNLDVGGNAMMSNGQVGGDVVMSGGQLGGNALSPAGQIGGILGQLPPLGNAVPEVVDVPEDALHQHGMRAIPYELMDSLNPSFYEPARGYGQDNWQSYDDLVPGHFHRHNMNPCHHSPCLNHGKCHFSHRHHRMYNFKCVCNTAFSGHYCEISPYSCHPNPCHNGGTCTKTKSLVFCSCLPDFKGHHCEEERACLVNPCLNDAVCTETNGGFHCQCSSPAFGGRICEEHISVCDSNPCKNGGTCRDLEADRQFECTCPNGFGCIDCSCSIEPSEVGSHIATTMEHGETEIIHGNTILMHQDSHICPPNNCHNGGTCIRGSSGFLCNCPTGFHGLNCGIPDLCSPNPCENNGVCVQDGDENYKCICPYGFKGTDCQLSLSCSGHPCTNGATCIETSDSYHCKCTAGYKGVKCTDISPCSHNPCLHKSTCFEKGTMYTCKCKSGYQGKTCHEKNPCFPNPCSNGQCMERLGSTICKCNEGWMGDLCDVEDLCHQANHCLNGGTCVHRYSEFKCLCAAGFHGDTCELRLPCYDNPCQNGGICEEEGDVFVCKCSTGFHGEKCHLQSHCFPNPCENDGRCFESSDSFVCDCPHSYLGKMCQEERFCMSNPCLNGGHCTEIDDVFRCNCPFGYFGRVCDINVCDHNPCRNGGTCMPANNPLGYACECVFPYHGHQCDEMDACMPNPCRHAGICHSHLQHIQEMSYHEGPQFHGADESVVSVVGPLYNETLHHQPYYDSHEHSLKYAPDEHLVTNEVHHFHMTSDYPETVYADQLYHAKYGDNGFHSNDDDFVHRDVTHNGLYPDHRLVDGMSGSFHVDEKRTFGSKSKKTKKSHVPKKWKNNKRHLEQKDPQKRASVERIPQIVVNMRIAKSNIVKRTIHDLYVCQCTPGFLGAHCQHINPCDTNPCHNHGICVPRGEIFQCQCINGFGGVNCDDPHPCTPNPCLHGGKCLLARTVHGYLCECSVEWRGNNCESRDMCAVHNPCLHGGLCVNVDEGKVACKCRARFNGDRCENDKCANCDVHAYCHHGNCVCKPDFVGNGFKCRALGDICEPNPCDNGGVCKHGVDGKLFTCECLHGFLGTRCELPNPCANSPCLHNGACIDASNSKDKGILMADRNDYKCFCTPGYRGKNCEEMNLAACSSGPCQNHGFCFDASSESHKNHLSHADDYECFCAAGYSGDNCEYEHYPCISSPCMNGGQCLDAQKLPSVNFDAHGYKCRCNHGFAGRNCEVTIDGLGACHSGPCMHDGRCVDIISNNDPDLQFDFDHEFKCFCSALFSGKLCEVPYPACHSSPCLHNGTCFDKTHTMDILFDDSGYECKCSPGYEGKNCERQYAMNIMDDTVYDQSLTDASIFDNHHPDSLHHLGADDETAFAEGDWNRPQQDLTGHHPGEVSDEDSLREHHITDEDEDPYNTHHMDVVHYADHKLDEAHGTAHNKPGGLDGNPFTHPLDGKHNPSDSTPHQTNTAHSADAAHLADTVHPTETLHAVHAADARHAANGDNFVHNAENMQHLVLPNHRTTPQPVLAHPVIDTVAHHPPNPLVANEKYNFPIRNPNPTPTMPILLNKDNSWLAQTESAVAKSFRNSYINYRNAHRPDYLTSSRVIYGANGRRSGIAK